MVFNLLRKIAVFTFLMLAIPLNCFGLNILLTGDDGITATGIQVMKMALENAGHTVTVVAPSGNASGSSAGLNLGEAFAFVPISPNEFAVARLTEGGVPLSSPLPATPIEAICMASTILPTDPLHSDFPDLVISGINDGSNAGTLSNTSGTIGGALGGASKILPFGSLPSIAISMESSAFSDLITEADKHFEDASDFIVFLIEILDSADNGCDLLPEGIFLNINYPARAKDAIKGIKILNQGDSFLSRETDFVFPPGIPFPAGIYSPQLVVFPIGPATFILAAAPAAPNEAVIKADTTHLVEGFITIVPSSQDRTLKPAEMFNGVIPLPQLNEFFSD